MLTSQVSVKPGFRQEAAALRAPQQQPDRREPEFPCVLLVLMLKLLVTVPVSSKDLGHPSFRILWFQSKVQA